MLLGLASMPAALGVGAGLSLAPVALAHRSRVALTRVLANDRAGTWEFITTLHLHDAALALAALTGDARADPATPAGQARLALELERTLTWRDPRGVALQPVAEGAELLGSDLALYQSSPMPTEAGDYAVRSRFLAGVYPDMAHTVQFDVVSPARVARLSASRPEATFPWTPSPVNASRR